MNFETNFDPFYRPQIGRQAEAAFGVRTGTQGAGATGEGTAREASNGDPADSNTARLAEAAEADFEFADFLDVINPLQHIPLVSSLYRELTGDEIKAPARILGGLLFGGPVGFVAAAVNAIVAEASGRDLTENAVAVLFGEEEDLSQVAASGLSDAAEEDATIAATQFSAPIEDAGDFEAAVAAVGATPESGAGLAIPALGPEAVGATQTSDNSGAIPESDPAAQGQLVTGTAALEAFLKDRGSLARAVAGTRDTMPPSADLVAAATPQKTPKPQGSLAGIPLVMATSSGPVSGGVPANLNGLKLRDLRGTEIRPALSMPRSGNNFPNIGGPRSRVSLTGAVSSGQLSPVPNPAITNPVPVPLLDSPGSAGLSDRLAPGAASGNDDFSAQMIQALQKYESLIDPAKKNGPARP